METHAQENHQDSRPGEIETPFRRNRFFAGKMLRVPEFQAEQDYFIRRRRLINRAVLGWGVACGLQLQGAPDETGAKAISVGAGLALDRHGREIANDHTVVIGFDNTFLRKDGRVLDLSTLEAGTYLLSIHYAERPTGEVNLGEGCGCEQREHDFVVETAVFSLERLDECGCPCAEEERPPCACGRRGSCGKCGGRRACLCQWISGASDAGDGTLCRWRTLGIGVGAPVPLACVSIRPVPDPCHPAIIGWIEDDCGPRKLLKGNETLYDLIRGQDLVRIERVSWEDLLRDDLPVPWEKFVDLFSSDEKAGQEGAKGTLTKFTVSLSGPIQSECLRAEAVAMTVLVADAATGWRVPRRVPITDLEPGADEGSGTTRSFTFRVRPRWSGDELSDGPTWLSARYFNVEIEIRGDQLLDCHGRGVDANSRGPARLPTGNGSPGGTFFSAFRVSGKPHQRVESED